jgi:DNA helicase-2/ATP-dependent DNA helicase PcrA
LLNPRDELAWGRLLKLLPGVGETTADRLTASAIAADTVAQAAEVLAGEPLPAAAREGIRKLSDSLRRAATCAGVGARFDVILDYYDPLLRVLYDDWPARQDDLNSLRQIAAAYDGSLERFLSDIAIEPPEKSDGRADPALVDDERPLTLSTIHSAKGLEWDSVFLLGVRDGVLPSSRSIQDDEDVEEEHRLFYVAVTRSKTSLYLTMSHYGRNDGVERLQRPSRFIEAPNVKALLDCTSESNGTVSSIGSDAPLPVLGTDGLLDRLRQMQGG